MAFNRTRRTLVVGVDDDRARAVVFMQPNEVLDWIFDFDTILPDGETVGAIDSSSTTIGSISSSSTAAAKATLYVSTVGVSDGTSGTVTLRVRGSGSPNVYVVVKLDIKCKDL
jgi:hypothetical protein